MTFEINLKAIGERIEKLRGRLSQAEFAEALGIDRKTVGTWERGERLPDTKALIGLWGVFDADPAWVLTGGGYAPTGSDDERELISLFRAAPIAVKAAAIGALQGGSSPAPRAPKPPATAYSQAIHSNAGQVSQSGDIHVGKTKGRGGRK